MNTTASSTNVATEEQRVALWRAEELERAGFAPAAASALAVSREVDLHAALDLVRQGCPHGTALRILL